MLDLKKMTIETIKAEIQAFIEDLEALCLELANQINDKEQKHREKKEQMKNREKQFKLEEAKLKEDLDNEIVDTNNPYLLIE
jgi:ElaB/YqjD/DUF883 family membrane-anchored ribosome-binding protein